MKQYEYGFLTLNESNGKGDFLSAKTRQVSERYKDSIHAFADLGKKGWLQVDRQYDRNLNVTVFTFVRETT